MLCRSRAVCMGYLNNKQKTLETIDDEGWLHSGDLVRGDDEGFYKVVGRIKEIIIPSGGENIAPTNIEDEIRNSLPSAISNVMVCGDGKQYLTCLLTLKVRDAGNKKIASFVCSRSRWIFKLRSPQNDWSSRPAVGSSQYAAVTLRLFPL